MKSRSTRRARVIAGLASVVLVASCQSSDDVGIATWPLADTASVPMPERRGVLMESGPIAEAGVDGSVTAIRYSSEDVDGSIIEVTGLVVVPEGDPPQGGFPVMSWAHGTTGVADRCAPSRSPATALVGLGAAVDAGFVVVATDYAGLGAPGVHPYLVSASEGRSVLDAVAALDGLDVETSGQLVLAGASQGGHAALAAAEIAQEWLPSFELRGTIALAPAADLELLVAGMFASSDLAGFGVLIAASWADVYEDLAREDVLGPGGMEVADLAVGDSCVVEVFDAASIVSSEELAVARPIDIPAWAARAAENTIHADRVAGPVLLIHGEADEVIPFAASQRLDEALCAAGVATRFVPYPDTGHGGVVVSMGDAVRWAVDRLGDVPAPSTCG